jgi:hypothetical protein
MSRPMSHKALLASAALVATLAASPAAARDSWGKPNVGFTEYRLDADQCSNSAFDTNLWIGPIYDVIRKTMATQGDIYTIGFSQQLTVHAVTVTIADQLQDAVDRCLIDRGYERFRLTQAQDRQLSRYRRGTTERAQFLHSLAADPSVMMTQALPTVRPPDAPAEEGRLPRREPPIIIPTGPRPI